MTKKCFIVAMEEEVSVFLKENQTKLKKIENKPFIVYEIGSCIVAISGIGLINASACTTFIIEKYHPSEIVNIGLAGANDKRLNIIDKVIVSECYHGGVDATMFGYKFGQTPKVEPFFMSDVDIVSRFQKNDLNLKSGKLASTDSFIGTNKAFEENIAPLNVNIELMDMEAFGMYQICHKWSIPCASIKIVSDSLCGSKDNNLQFIEILGLGAEMIAKVMIKYILEG